MKVPFIIIGGGLSGLAAAIRFARYSPEVLLLEKHSRIGGLNSYYYRNNRLFETGLHAITNFAPTNQKHAPINRLFRQLKLSRKTFEIYPQCCSEIHFENQQSLLFSNDFNVLNNNIAKQFPHCYQGFVRLCNDLKDHNPFKTRPYHSARNYIFSYLGDKLLTDMLLCPLMFYGSSVENDMDLDQFVIMFRSIFEEGMFRPAGTIKDFLDTLKGHYLQLGGKLRLHAKVTRIIHEGPKVIGIELANGEVLECDHLISTAGIAETRELLGETHQQSKEKRLGFVESIFLLPKKHVCTLPSNRTIIFYNRSKTFNYAKPKKTVDFESGVICFPSNFQGKPEEDFIEIRSTHLANFHNWQQYIKDPAQYALKKQATAHESVSVLEKIIGNFREHIIYEDTFTPLTINKYTAKKEGAIYGSPVKVKDGYIGYSNLFVAGTDQGFLGIIGSMLSGVSMVNQHILPKI